MDFPDLIAKYGMEIRGVLHCGAHLAEEAPVYRDLGIERAWFVEGNTLVLPKLEPILAQYPGYDLVHALLWERDGETMTLNITNFDGMSSSLLAFGSHVQFSPDTIYEATVTAETRTVDSLVAEHGIEANFASFDLQGVEGPVLRGAIKFLKSCDYIICEVNSADVYIGATRVEEIDAILSDFDRVETHWVDGQNWGDACMIRRGL